MRVFYRWLSAVWNILIPLPNFISYQASNIIAIKFLKYILLSRNRCSLPHKKRKGRDIFRYCNWCFICGSQIEVEAVWLTEVQGPAQTWELRRITYLRDQSCDLVWQNCTWSSLVKPVAQKAIHTLWNLQLLVKLYLWEKLDLSYAIWGSESSFTLPVQLSWDFFFFWSGVRNLFFFFLSFIPVFIFASILFFNFLLFKTFYGFRSMFIVFEMIHQCSLSLKG